MYYRIHVWLQFGPLFVGFHAELMEQIGERRKFTNTLYTIVLPCFFSVFPKSLVTSTGGVSTNVCDGNDAEGLANV